MKFHWHPVQYLKDLWSRLRELRDAPHAVAGGVSIGLFWAFTPFTGLKTLLSIITAWLCRCSKLPAVVAVAMHDVLLPVWPIILRWEYDLGFWICSYPHHFPPPLGLHKLRLAALFDWKTLQLIWPTFLGSCAIGLPISLMSYYLVKYLLERYEARRHIHLKPPA